MARYESVTSVCRSLGACGDNRRLDSRRYQGRCIPSLYLPPLSLSFSIIVLSDRAKLLGSTICSIRPSTRASCFVSCETVT